MKKMAIMISILVGTLIFILTAGPVFSQAVKDDFNGCQFRTMVYTPTPKINGCRYNVDGQEANWTISVDNKLIDGAWYNWDTKVRRDVLTYTIYDKDGAPTTVDCVPSEDPPAYPYCGSIKKTCFVANLGTGINFGPVMLTPTDAGGGQWVGRREGLWHPDGSRSSLLEAKGHGGLIEGMSLHVNTYNSAEIPPTCDLNVCCPADTGPLPKGAYGPILFEGWTLTPASVK
jgi:hypothetical protein